MRPENVKNYLDRIGYHGQHRPSLQLLQKLHSKHLLSVPFENLDIHLGRPIVLDEAPFYEKIVEHRRGGFCYELNGLFAALLKALGFKVSILSAKVARDNGRFSPDFDHMTLLVHLKQQWLVDVGFGDSFTQPKSLDTSHDQRDDGRAYSVINRNGNYLLARWDDEQNSWKPQYKFTLRRRKLSDFTARCRWQQTSPQSHFKKGRLVSRPTGTGRITLTDAKFIITKNGKKVQQPVRSMNRFNQILQDKFEIKLD